MTDKKESSFIDRNFTRREQIMLYSLICIVILVGGIYFLILPALDKNDMASSQLIVEQDTKTEMEMAIANAETNRQAIGEIKSQLGEASQYYFEPMLTEDVDIFLAKLAKKHRLTPKKLTMARIVPYGYILPEEERTDGFGGSTNGGGEGQEGLSQEVGVIKSFFDNSTEAQAEEQTAADEAKAAIDEAATDKGKANATVDVASQLDQAETEDPQAEDEVATKNKKFLQTPGAQTVWVSTLFFSLEGEWANMTGFIDEISKTKSMYIASFTKSDEESTGLGGEGTTVFTKPKLDVVIQILMYQDEMGENKILYIAE